MILFCRALLFGGLKESRPGCSEIELKGTTADAFRALLKYIYTGKMSLQEMKVRQRLHSSMVVTILVTSLYRHVVFLQLVRAAYR